MIFKEGQKYASTFEVDGFKFKKEVTRCQYEVSVKIKTLDGQLVDEMTVLDIYFIEQVDELLSQSIYNYIERNADELDKIMAYYTKGVGSFGN
ncbi:DUF1108 family protein [Staphylococcus sp. IVB6214]|uniref:DUF1108 family protein n=1 Tax=Staphylococcus sp. IVB6214 TaxID=2989766 RepID=UPI0021D10E60|nr:DUF1108 family protein [Staphylococcus sp. IVB6214]UXR83198.1 DUF1108 family protein [Staphylococcus sp. IVB6214]